MTRYMPLAAPLVGLVIALGIVAIEVGRGDGGARGSRVGNTDPECDCRGRRDAGRDR